MRRDQVVAGFTRIPKQAFKAGIMDAARTESAICERLRLAIKTAAARRGVRREVRDQYLAWIAEVEAVLAAVAEADHAQMSGAAQ